MSIKKTINIETTITQWKQLYTVYMYHKKCHFTFDYNYGCICEIFTLFLPVKTEMNTLHYLLNTFMISHLSHITRHKTLFRRLQSEK